VVVCDDGDPDCLGTTQSCSTEYSFVEKSSYMAAAVGRDYGETLSF
jgi:hypothetical protein